LLKCRFMINRKKIDICLSTHMIDLFNLANKQVVIIDVFRATSAMCVFLNNGGKEVIPVSSVDEATIYNNRIELSNNNFLVAAERNGSIVPGFDLGNSPLSYHKNNFKNTSLIITTTNGTLAIEKAKKNTSHIILASFLNIEAVTNYLIDKSRDVIIVCSGWRGRSCVEDLLLAGLLSCQLLKNSIFYTESDSFLLAKSIYNLSKSNMLHFLSESAYSKRMDLYDDMKYCLQQNIMKIVPVWSSSSYLNPEIGSFS